MLALDNIRILDFSRLAPGPFCTLMLADMGAEVVLVEAPPSRLPSTRDIPATSQEQAQKTAAYSSARRNKRSIVLDLQTEEGRNVIYKLAETTDVVVEGFRPGVVKRLGVDYETLRKINDRIVYCSISGYGQDGPYVGLAGHDINYISIGGALGALGPQGGPPIPPMNLLADFAGGGLMAAYAVAVALLARTRTGKGQYVDIAMSDGVLQLLSTAIDSYFQRGEVPHPGVHRYTGGWPHYGVYQCSDGAWISIASLEPHFFTNLCRIMGCEDFIAQQQNEEKHAEIRAHFTQRFKTRTRDEWFATFQESDICAAPVYGLDEALQDPHNLHRKMVIEVEAPHVGKVKQVGIAPKLSETPGAVRFTAPVAGQHTDEILESIGYGPDMIAKLRESGAVR